MDEGRACFARSVLLSCGLVVAAPHVAMAQASLDGNFIDYLHVGADGTMIGGGRSMRYRETSTDPYSCDLWFPDDPISTFTVRATGAGLGGFFAGTNDGTAFPGVRTSSATAAAGRTITWAGRIDAGLLGAGELTVRHAWTFEVDDRVVIQTITLENTGSVSLSDIYYVTHGDPDHGNCDIGTANETLNDVVRQPPTDTSALVTASTVAAASRSVVIGMGAFDAAGRAHVSAALTDTDPVGAWMSPSDPNGASADRGMSVAFRVLSLAVDATATFQVFYVWGSSVASVTSRFDDALCRVRADGTSCSVAGAPGTCHARGCCTGCWNGTSCATGNAVAACGAAGGACASCDDANACTDDACAAGTCARTNNTAACEDGAFCTSGDRCAAGACVPGAPRACGDALACTTDACDETANACTSVVSLGCAIDGMCVASGAANPADACLGCVPSSSTSMWTYAPGPTCDGDGDGVPDVIERPGGVDRDTDGDGTPDHRDADDDGDGVLTRAERPMGLDLDTDGDAIPDYRDADDDGDGVATTLERPLGMDVDTDGDVMPDYLDADDDGDGLASIVERMDEAAEGGDVDGDGFPAYLDTDADGDSVGDTTEGRGDLDGDGTPNYLDPDSAPRDMDGDGVPDAEECPSTPCRDTDGDGTPDVMDLDDDGDGIPTRTEREDETREGGDVDGDSVPAFRDLDSDMDGRPDRDEGTTDTDGDGVPDYLDPDGTGVDGGVIDGGGVDGGVIDGGRVDGGVIDGGGVDGGVIDGSVVDGSIDASGLDANGSDAGTRPGGLAGGALCSASAGGPTPLPASLVSLFALIAFGLARKRGAR